MSIYTIGDLHLSFKENKPMSIFGENWENHEIKIKQDWLEKVKEDDLVILPGDFSWAMYLEDSDENQCRYWILGEPFFKKYKFIFNKDSKTMGIYTSINNKDNRNTWWSKYKWYFILIVLLVILLCGLSVLLFLFLRKPKKRKIKANELDDEFDYTSDKNKLTSDIID